MRYRQGFFTPRHPEKYVGDPNHIVYRSGLELKCMQVFDEQPHILKWASEEVAIPYISPIDNAVHRYFVDFLVSAKQKDGTVKTFAVEIKPEKQTQEPRKQSKKTKRYISEVKTWLVNKAKWTAAKTFCESKGWDFMIMTDRHILGKTYKSYKRYKKK